MGRRGPKPKSPELESAQGFPGKRNGKTKAALRRVGSPKTECKDDIQDDPLDSRNVLPPRELFLADERAAWKALMSSPDARFTYKRSDCQELIRYCQLWAMFLRIMKQPPKPTYTTRTLSGARIIRRNPTFDQMLAISRELGSIGARLGLNPSSRLSLEKAGFAQSKILPSPDDGGDGQKSTASGKSTGPIGCLKSPHKMN